MAAAIHGCSQASRVTPATAPSSVRLATTLVTGSGEALTAKRMPPLARWLASAMPPVPAAVTACPRVEASPASRAPITPPMAGRTTVCTLSQALST